MSFFSNHPSITAQTLSGTGDISFFTQFAANSEEPTNTLDWIGRSPVGRHRDGNLVACITSQSNFRYTSLEELRINDHYSLKRNLVPESKKQQIDSIVAKNIQNENITSGPGLFGVNPHDHQRSSNLHSGGLNFFQQNQNQNAANFFGQPSGPSSGLSTSSNTITSNPSPPNLFAMNETSSSSTFFSQQELSVLSAPQGTILSRSMFGSDRSPAFPDSNSKTYEHGSYFRKALLGNPTEMELNAMRIGLIPSNNSVGSFRNASNESEEKSSLLKSQQITTKTEKSSAENKKITSSQEYVQDKNFLDAKVTSTSQPKTISSNAGSFSFEMNKMLFISSLMDLLNEHCMSVPEDLLDSTNFVPEIFEFFKGYNVAPSSVVPKFKITKTPVLVRADKAKAEQTGLNLVEKTQTSEKEILAKVTASKEEQPDQEQKSLLMVKDTKEIEENKDKKQEKCGSEKEESNASSVDTNDASLESNSNGESLSSELKDKLPL